jgi:enamine deaminase RidA (YjgF/YER057c/UK114 family)
MTQTQSMDSNVVRQRYRTSNPYEEKFGYSRAVRRGPFIFVSGTTSIDPETGKILHPTSAYRQTLTIFLEILRALAGLAASKDDVVRLRMFVTAPEDAQDVGRALKEVFGDVQPAATMIIGSKFVEPEMRVEIEADAVVLLVRTTEYPNSSSTEE